MLLEKWMYCNIEALRWHRNMFLKQSCLSQALQLKSHHFLWQKKRNNIKIFLFSLNLAINLQNFEEKVLSYPYIGQMYGNFLSHEQTCNFNHKFSLNCLNLGLRRRIFHHGSSRIHKHAVGLFWFISMDCFTSLYIFCCLKFMQFIVSNDEWMYCNIEVLR